MHSWCNVIEWLSHSATTDPHVVNTQIQIESFVIIFVYHILTSLNLHLFIVVSITLYIAAQFACDMLGCSFELLEQCLTQRIVETSVDIVLTPLSDSAVRNIIILSQLLINEVLQCNTIELHPLFQPPCEMRTHL